MPYLTAGVAFAQGSHTSDTDINFPPATGEGSATHVGWTAGLGVAIKATDNMSVNLEYRHNEFGDQTYDENSAPYDPNFSLSSNQITVGLHWMM
jgi:outer membrane immunogenic protein